MPSDPEFHVFLCHNSRDQPAVKEIAERLQRRGLRPWLDEWELRPEARRRLGGFARNVREAFDRY